MKPKAILLLAVAALLVSGQDLPPRKSGENATDGRGRRWALVLEDQPVADLVKTRAELRGARALAARAAIQGKQAGLRRLLKARGIRITASTDTVENAVYVEASREQAMELGSLPGVRWVEPVQELKRAGNVAIQLVNAPSAWAAVGGEDKAGQGVRIGIIDSGIDQTHPAFQDPSLAAPDKRQCYNDTSGDCAFTNNKVIYARSYVRLVALPEYPEDSRPDDLSPRDRVGHGTAVAALAAGFGHDSPIGRLRGVAPKAYLGNYKVFGSPGVNDVTFTDVVSKALEDALYDEMDVVTLSLSVSAVFGPLDKAPNDCGGSAGAPCDARAEAVARVARLGMAVVVAAGNEGDSGQIAPSFNTVGSPGSSPSAITVGATTNGHQLYQSVAVPGDGVPDNLKRFIALFGDGPRPAEALTAPLKDVSQLEDNGQACSPLARGSLDGAFALIQAEGCTLRTKVLHAQAAGAKGVVFVRPEGRDFVFPPTGLTYTAIPLVLIGNTNGKALREFLGANPGREVTMDPNYYEFTTPDGADVIAYFSSYGPAIGTSAIKPELVAPGTDLFVPTQDFDPASEMYSATRYTVAQGTSFAVPLVAGAIALSRQTLPGLKTLPESERAEVLKSSVVNTANSDVYDIDSSGNFALATLLPMGSGKVDAQLAAVTPVTISPSTLNFGVLNQATLPVRQSLVFTNQTNTEMTLSLSVQRWVNDSSAQLTISPATFTLQPGAKSNAVTVSLSGQKPAAGSYQGVILVRFGGSSLVLQVPFLYSIGNATAFNLIPLRNFDFVGQANQRLRGGFLFKVVDRFGVPVANAKVAFRVVSGGGEITEAYPSLSDPRTDINGIAEATTVWLGPTLGTQVFEAEVLNSGLPVLRFSGTARLAPMLMENSVVNTASQRLEPGIAPGSIVSFRGMGLSEMTLRATGGTLPLQLGGVSVSFDEPSQNLSLPGSVLFVSPERVDVQVPWDVGKLASVKTKVSIDGFTSTPLVQVAVSAIAPGLYNYTDPVSGQVFADAMDEAGNRIGSQNRAKRGTKIKILAGGLGSVANRPSDGVPAQELSSPLTGSVTVRLGDRELPVEYAGLASGLTGIYEIRVSLPADLPGGTQDLTVTAEGISSPAARLPIEE